MGDTTTGRSGSPRRGPAQVVIVGGGFAGFACARRLLRTVRRDRLDAEVTLVSPDDYLLYTSLLPDVAGGLLDPRHVAVSLAQALPGVRLVTGTVETVELEARTVDVRGAGDPVLRWNRLVLTPGSVTRMLDVPGIHEHAHGLKSLAEALYLRDHLLGQLEVSEHLADEEARDAARTVVVVGASYAGTELVAQLRALADAAADRHHFARSDVRFLLLDAADAVMAEVGGTLGERALHVLEARGIDVRLGTTLTEITASSVTLDDGRRVATRTVVWVAGVEANPLVAGLGLPLDGGRLVVRPDLSVPGHPGVFAGGDAAAVPDLVNHAAVTAPTAQHAQRQGTRLARNVAASLGHGTAKPYRHRDLGLVVDLGPHFAVADPLGAHLSGFAAKVVTRGYHLAALPGMANRIGVAADWATDLVSRRPVIRLGLVDPSDAAVTGHHPEADPDGDHPDGDHPDGDHPDGDHPDGDHPDGDHPDGHHPDGHHPDGHRPAAGPAPHRPEAVAAGLGKGGAMPSPQSQLAHLLAVIRESPVPPTRADLDADVGPAFGASVVDLLAHAAEASLLITVPRDTGAETYSLTLDGHAYIAEHHPDEQPVDAARD